MTAKNSHHTLPRPVKWDHELSNGIHSAKTKGRFIEIENKSTGYVDIIKLADKRDINNLLDLIFNRD